MRILLRALMVVLLGVVLLAGGGYGWLRQSLPQTSGTRPLAGLAADVEVLRDGYAIPHVFARSVPDALFALGYVHAQDRLWQMEMNRRIGAGRLSEMLGAAALETDRFVRTLGIRRAAAASYQRLDARTRAALQSYADGVNAFLATRPVLPPEFWILGVRPEPWDPLDSIAWVKMMAWDLGGNWRNELLRMRLATTLPNARIHEFLPPYPGDKPPAIRDLGALYRGLGEDALQMAAVLEPRAAAAPDLLGGAAGSNNWVVGRSRSATGAPLLANDPHLGLTAPCGTSRT